MDTCDVVVVGGRVAGAATALLLARAGVRVTVLERSRRGTDTISTHGLMRGGVMQLGRWGVLDALVAAGTPRITRTVFHYLDSDPVTVSIRPSAGVDGLYAPRRHVLDTVLQDAAEAAGADIRHRVTALAALRDDRGRVSGVRFRDGDGREGDLRATLTVGADGIASMIARDVSATVTRRGSFGSAILYGYMDATDAEGYEWAYGTGAAAGLLPTNDGETCVFVATTPARMRDLRAALPAESAFRELLRAASPSLAERLTGAAPIAPLRGWRGISGFIRHPHGPGWALVGDAGAFRDPISSHGMTDALRDAEILAASIVEMLSGAAPPSRALSRYHGQRDRLSVRMFDAADAIASYDWSSDHLRRLLRAHSSAMTDEVDYLAALPDGVTRVVRGLEAAPVWG